MDELSLDLWTDALQTLLESAMDPSLTNLDPLSNGALIAADIWVATACARYWLLTKRTSTPSLVALLSPWTYGLDNGLDQLWLAHSAKSGVAKTPAKILKFGDDCVYKNKNKNKNKDQRMTAITEEEAMSSELRESAWFSAKSGVVSSPGERSSMGLVLSASLSRDCLE